MAPGFEDPAADWIRFAPAEGPDAYWAYREAFFELLRPPGRALEIGCGEGRVTRDLRSRGFDVTGLEVAPTLVDADPRGTYVVGYAGSLPRRRRLRPRRRVQQPVDGEDMPRAVVEVGRLLREGGIFFACVPTHVLRGRRVREPCGRGAVRRRGLGTPRRRGTISASCGRTGAAPSRSRGSAPPGRAPGGRGGHGRRDRLEPRRAAGGRRRRGARRLAPIAEAVGGRVELLLDSGVRTGADVVTALALGARAVLLGRPYAGLGLAGGGPRAHVLRACSPSSS